MKFLYLGQYIRVVKMQTIKIAALTFTTVCHTGQVSSLLWALAPPVLHWGDPDICLLGKD